MLTMASFFGREAHNKIPRLSSLVFALRARLDGSALKTNKSVFAALA